MNAANRSLMIVTGEISGDMHAAGVVRALKKQNPDLTFFGIGGDLLRAEGMETVRDISEMAVLGLSEVLKKYGFFKKVMNEMVALAKERKPDAVLLVDYPGFNLRLARHLHELDIKVIYYICPQVWAWRGGRVHEMARVVDRLITIFPFEKEIFDGVPLEVNFAGHPLVDEAEAVHDEPVEKLPWGTEPHVAILPGSRIQEIDRLLPVMLRAAGLVEGRTKASFIIAAPNAEIAKMIKLRRVAIQGGPARCEIVVGKTRQVLRQAQAAFVASGTATIEAALMKCPMVIAYKTAPLTYMIGKQVVQIPHIGMVNVVAGEALCPELLQGKATPQNLASAIEPLLTDTAERQIMLDGLASVASALGEGDAGRRAADYILAELG